MPVFVTYFTGPQYQARADALSASCRPHGIPVRAEAVIDMGDWFNNCLLKPALISRCLNDYRQPPRNVVFLDADMVVESYPNLLVDGVFGVDVLVPYHLGKVIGGPIRFRNVLRVRELVRRWGDEVRNPARARVCDMTTLGEILEAQTEVSWQPLPPSYYWIPEMFINTEHAHLVNAVVIRHDAINRSRWSSFER